MNDEKFQKDDVILIKYLDNTTYGKLVHFYSMNEGNYYARVVENQNIIIYDRLSIEEEKELIEELNINEYQEV